MTLEKIVRLAVDNLEAAIDDDDVVVVGSVYAGHAAVALSNARLVERLEAARRSLAAVSVVGVQPPGLFPCPPSTTRRAISPRAIFSRSAPRDRMSMAASDEIP